MDANKFMTEYDRMCKNYNDCPECPLFRELVVYIGHQLTTQKCIPK